MRIRSCVLALLLIPAVSAAVPTMPPDELVVGEPGVCLTEMDGGEMVEIPLTVLGVLAATGPEGERVLVRLHGERFEHAGIIAGMSGSPVYVRDRLVGALAFGWAFAKDPIAGVTPFTRMETLAGTHAEATSFGGGERPPLAAVAEAVAEGGLGDLVLDWLLPDEDQRQTLPLPVAASAGRPPAWLGRAWDRLGWVDAPAMTAAAGRGGEGPLTPGAAVCGVLVEGDASLSVGGTVTEVRGDEVWAFGHPFLGGDALRMPMARGHVVAVLPSLYSSFKFIAPGASVGALEVDRSHGVWGRLGPAPPLVPVEVSIGDRSYSFRALRHPVLLPYLVGYLTASSHAARGRTFGDESVRTEVEVAYEGVTARVGNLFVGPGASAEAAGYASAVVALFENGEFRAPALEAVRVRLDAVNELHRATVVDIVPDRPLVAPGDDLGVRVRVLHQGGREELVRLSVPIPPWLPDGRVDLVVADGASWTAYDLQMRRPSPDSFASLARLLDRLRPASRLIAVLERKESGLTIPGGAVAAPPGVIVNLGSALGGNLTAWSYRVIEQVEEDLPFALAGAARIPLVVRAQTPGNLMDGDR